MTLKRNSGGSFVDISTTFKRRASGSWTNLAFILRKSGASWVTVWSAVALTDITVSSVMTSSGVRLNSSGDVQSSLDGSPYATEYPWLVLGTNSEYEVMASGLTGDTPSGTFGSWLALSSTRTWELAGTGSCSFTLQIRRASDSLVITSATMTLTVA